MQGYGSYAAQLPELRAQWRLSYASAGWIEGAFQAGYPTAVPILVPLTDRVDARRIFAGAALIGGLATLGFATCGSSMAFGRGSSPSWPSVAHSPAPLGSLSPAALAAAILMLGLPASVLGNELALRRGRRPVIAGIMLASAFTSLFVGASALLPMIATLLACAFYSMTITGESASLTAGAVAAAAPAHRGATLAVHTLLGFAAATLGLLAFGITLDVVGADRWVGWAVGFAVLGAGPALGPFLLKRIARSAPA